MKLYDEYDMVVDAGEQAMSTDPFKGQLIPPSWFVKNERKDNKLPN